MSRMVFYVCDVCTHQSEEPYGFHVTIERKGGKRVADICSQQCAMEFMKQESSGLPETPDSR